MGKNFHIEAMEAPTAVIQNKDTALGTRTCKYALVFENN
jgi:hypothetical protein